MQKEIVIPCLDLYDQWTAMEKNKQWRFTPPTHVLAAFNQAIVEHEKGRWC